MRSGEQNIARWMALFPTSRSRHESRSPRESKKALHRTGRHAMRTGYLWHLVLIIAAVFVGTPALNAGSLTYSHNSSALPGAPGPAITLQSITGTNDGT